MKRIPKPKTGGARTKASVSGLARAKSDAKRVAIVQYDDRPTDSMEPGFVRMMQLNEAYCRHHGYEYLFFDQYIPTTNNPELKGKPVSPYWAKVLIVRDILAEGNFDYVMWLDTDAVINQTWMSIPSFFRWAVSTASAPVVSPLGAVSSGAKTKAVLAISQDAPEWYGHPHNAGVWIAHNTPDAISFFDAWLSHYDEKTWKRNPKGKWICRDEKTNRACPWAGLAYEQGSLSLLDQNLIVRLPWSVLANFDYNRLWDKHAFAMHFMGDFRNGMYRYLSIRDDKKWPSARVRIRDYAAELDRLSDRIQRAESAQKISIAHRLFLQTKAQIKRWVDEMRARVHEIQSGM